MATSPNEKNIVDDSTIGGISPPHATDRKVDRDSVEGFIKQSDVLLSGRSLTVVFSSFMMAFSLVALDQTIISTSLPTIASHFQAVSDISWIASAYFLPQAGLMLFFGGVLVIAPAKAVFLVSVLIFELGSLFCAVAFSVNFLIFGRAVAGIGAAGIWVSIMSIVARVTTITQRPLLMGLFGAVYAVCSVVGPLLGGVFADHVSWRWCFYINLPIGGAGFVISLFTIPSLPVVNSRERSHLQAWLHLDWLGTIFSLAAVIFFLIPLQWGGNTRPWSDPLVIAFLVLAVFFVFIFVIWEHKAGSSAILPVAMLRRKTIFGAFLESSLIQFSFVLAVYYLPLLYQVRGHSATKSGIDILPFMISGVFATIIAGGIITAKGYPWPFLFFFPLVSSVAFGLLFTTTPSTSFARLIGYQILLGVGLGAAIQNTVVIAQAEYVEQQELVPQATSLVTFMQLVGSSIGLAAGGAIFSGQLRTQLRIFAPDLPPDIQTLVLESVKAILSLSDTFKGPVTHAYVSAIDHVFIGGIASSALAGFAAILIRRDKISLRAVQGVAA